VLFLTAETPSTPRKIKKKQNLEPQPQPTRVCFINAFQLRKRVPQGLKPAFLKVLIGTAREAAEKLTQGREKLTAGAKAQRIFNGLRHD
jgi:hypothetical protein